MEGVQTRQERDALWSSIDTKDCPVGSILQYELIETLRQGTYGKVFKAREKASGTVVAIKRLKISAGACQEIKIMRRITMENIVQLHEVCQKPPWMPGSPGASGDRGRKLYIVMEFCGRRDLSDVLNGAQPLREFTPRAGTVARFMRSVLRAIAYLHDQHVVHLDVKPENLLLTGDGEAKLVDFGLAMELDPTTGELETRSLEDMRGTVGYMPPEMILDERGHPNVKAADVWAAGSVMTDVYCACLFSRCQRIEEYLARISRVCGSIDERSLPGLRRLQGPEDVPLPRHCGRTLRDEMRPYVDGDPAALHLLDEIFVLDPARRITAHRALQHHYFSACDRPAAQHTPPLATATQHSATDR